MRSLHHRTIGPSDAPLLVLGPSLGTSTAVWEAPLGKLARDHRVLAYDLPGHGGSPAALLRDPGGGATTVAELAALVIALVDGHGYDRFHYAGISLGGAIGAHLAVHAPERVRSLAMVCSSAHFGEPGPWRDRAALVRDKGMAPLLDTSPARWFADPDTGTSTEEGRALLKNLADTEPAGYAACCDALAAYDIREDLPKITAPALVIGGEHDVATPLHHARELADGMPRATLRAVRTGHLALEEPHRVTTELASHLAAAEQP